MTQSPYDSWLVVGRRSGQILPAARDVPWQRALLFSLVVSLLGSGPGIAVTAGAAGAWSHDRLAGDAQLRPHMQFNLTPQPSPPSGAGVTATPTPRAIVIPTAAPDATTTDIPDPTRAAIATVTPTPIITVEQAPTAVPSPVATATPAPTLTPAPTPTPAPPPVVAAPTLAPVSTVRVDFSAEDWRGGYFQGDGRFYGRPWVAVYGALGDYPRGRR